MDNRQLHKKISVLIRLILLLIVIIYIIIKEVYFSDKSLKTDSVSTVQQRSISTEITNDLQYNIEASQWVNDRYAEHIKGLDNYINLDTNIDIWICDNKIDKYAKISDLQTIGFEIDGLNTVVYSFGELYGNVLSMDDTTIFFSCTNISTESETLRDCYLTDIDLTEQAYLSFGNNTIDFGDSLRDITDKLSGLNLETYNLKENSIFPEYINVIYNNNTNWKIIINLAEQVDQKIMYNRYTLFGTKTEGLTDIKYNLDIITKDILLDNYKKINN